MPSTRIIKTVAVARSPRVLQLEGLFDLAPTETSSHTWEVTLPLEERDWNVGLIVGPSGSGKSTVAREMFTEHLVREYQWPKGQSVVDSFPSAMGMREITGLLSSVGFSSPPAWLRPFEVLSTGEQFRVTLARALAEDRAITVIDEFTSTVDRTVAQVGSAAVAKTTRRLGRKLVAVTCHYDVEDWLQPDWIYQPHINRFQWRELQRRPEVVLSITRCGREAWDFFRQHHYLNTDLAIAARCFLATLNDTPVAFVAVLPNAGHVNMWREHRCVCLPDYQGVGIGMQVSNAVGSIVRAATDGSYGSVTSHPAFIGARKRSSEWVVIQAPSFHAPHTKSRQQMAKKIASQKNISTFIKGKGVHYSTRLMASFRFVGPPLPDRELARSMWEERFIGRG